MPEEVRKATRMRVRTATWRPTGRSNVAVVSGGSIDATRMRIANAVPTTNHAAIRNRTPMATIAAVWLAIPIATRDATREMLRKTARECRAISGDE
jgi:hypothetical protein